MSPAQLAQRRANVAAIAARRRTAPRATHCVRGHEFTPVNTYTRPGDSKRSCVTCRSDYQWYYYRGLGMAA